MSYHASDLWKELALTDHDVHHPRLIKGEYLIVIHLVGELIRGDLVQQRILLECSEKGV